MYTTTIKGQEYSVEPVPIDEADEGCIIRDGEAFRVSKLNKVKQDSFAEAMRQYREKHGDEREGAVQSAQRYASPHPYAIPLTGEELDRLDERKCAWCSEPFTDDRALNDAAICCSDRCRVARWRARKDG